MSVFLSHLWRVGLVKPTRKSLRSSSALVNLFFVSINGFSTSSVHQTPPISIVGATYCGDYKGRLVISRDTESDTTYLNKKVPMELVYNRETETIGSSNGWVATMNGVLRLHDDLNPNASDTDPKSISLPPLVTLPHCQTRVVTNVSMSTPSPEDKDCIVAVKFSGPQISFCRPGEAWFNYKFPHPCFFSSRVMFSTNHNMFRLPCSGGHLIASWDAAASLDSPPVFQRLRFRNVPRMLKSKTELLDSCFTTELLVDSTTTGETFLVKWYKKTFKIVKNVPKMKTQALVVFRLDDKGNAVYTRDIGDLYIYISKSEPFCVVASSLGLPDNCIQTYDYDEVTIFDLTKYSFMYTSKATTVTAPFLIPPQKLD